MPSDTAMSQPPKTPKARILLVDDERLVRALARRILETAGYEVHEAANGVDGVVRYLEEDACDLVIADLEMPLMGGAEMVRRIRAVQPSQKILYLTGHIDSLMDKRPLWEGEAFLEKPFTEASLCEAVSLLIFGTLSRGSDDGAQSFKAFLLETFA